MSIRLMVEVLDHYHGPAHRKLWLLALAEKASDETRAGWSPRSVLANRAEVTLTGSSHIATELEAEGAIKRDRTKRDDDDDKHRRRYRAARYVIQPLTDPRISARGNTLESARGNTLKPPAEHRKSVPREHRDGAPGNTQIPISPIKPSATREAAGLDPRMILAGMGADETEAKLIAAELENDPGIHDPAAYLLGVITDRGERAFLDRMRRHLDAQDPGGNPRPQRPPKPDWCGECDPDTRLTRDPDHPARCLRCHPLSASPPAAEPAAGSGWLKPWCGQCDTQHTRWAEATQPDGTVQLVRCPDCGQRR